MTKDEFNAALGAFSAAMERGDLEPSAQRDAVWNAAIEAALVLARRAQREVQAEVGRCNPDDVSGHRNYWLGNEAMTGKMVDALSALKRGGK